MLEVWGGLGFGDLSLLIVNNKYKRKLESEKMEIVVLVLIRR